MKTSTPISYSVPYVSPSIKGRPTPFSVVSFTGRCKDGFRGAAGPTVTEPSLHQSNPSLDSLARSQFFETQTGQAIPQAGRSPASEARKGARPLLTCSCW